MGKKRIAILATSTMLLSAGWMQLGVATTLTVGTAMVAGCSSNKAQTRQDTRTETRTEDRMENRRD